MSDVCVVTGGGVCGFKRNCQKSGFAYALSKSFVVWYAQKCAFEYGQKGIRVCSLSYGNI